QDIARLLQAFIMDGHLNVPQPSDPITIYNTLSNINRPRSRATHTRGVLRVTVSQIAQQIQIYDVNVISWATNMLKNAMTSNDREGFHSLSTQIGVGSTTIKNHGLRRNVTPAISAIDR
ncbi:12564_t:CDS:2, partial [Funneliformis mosseae]